MYPPHSTFSSSVNILENFHAEKTFVVYDWYACLHHHVSHHHEATQRKDNHLVTQMSL